LVKRFLYSHANRRYNRRINAHRAPEVANYFYFFRWAVKSALFNAWNFINYLKLYAPHEKKILINFWTIINHIIKLKDAVAFGVLWHSRNDNDINRLVEKSRFWGCLKSIFLAWKVDKQSIFEAKKSIKKALRLPNFKGRACKLDFPALHASIFAAYFTGWQLFEPEKSIKSRFWTQKSILSRKVEKVDFKYRFFDLKWLDSHSFDGFKFKEAT